MSKTTTQPPALTSLDMPLDEANIDGNVVAVFAKEKLKTFRDLETKTKGGNVWDWLLDDEYVSMPDVEDVRSKLAVAMGEGEGKGESSASGATVGEDAEPKKQAPKHYASKGAKEYRWKVLGRLGVVSYADGHAGVSIRAPRPADKSPGISLAAAEAIACGTVIDVSVMGKDDQVSIDGMEPEPVYVIAAVGDYKVSSKSVAFRLDIEAELETYKALAKLNKTDVVLAVNVVKHGREDIGDTPDPNQLTLGQDREGEGADEA